MKKILISSLLAICIFAETKALNMTYLDSAKAGPMCVVLYRHTIIQNNAHLQVSTVYSFNAAFNPAFINVVLDTTNTTGAQDTIYGVDTIPLTIVFPYLFKYKQQNVGNGNTSYSVVVQVSPYLIPVPPTMSYAQSVVALPGGGQQSYNYNAGNDTSTITFYVSPGDSAQMTQSFAMPLIVCTGAGFATYTFSGYPDAYWIGFYAVIENSVGSDTTDTVFFKTQVNTGTPWISELNSWSTTTDSAYTHFSCITFNTNTTAKVFISASQTGAAFDSASQFILGDPIGTIYDVQGNFGGLSANTPYWVWAETQPGVISSRMQIYTQVAPVFLSVAITNAQTISSVTEQFEVQITSAVPGWFNVVITNDTLNTTFSGGNVFATSTQTFSAGFTSNIVNVSSFNGSGFIPYHWYLAKSFAYNNNGENLNSMSVVFQFLPQFTSTLEVPKIEEKLWAYDNWIYGTGLGEGDLVVYDTKGALVYSKFLQNGFDIRLDFRPGVYIARYRNQYTKFVIR